MPDASGNFKGIAVPGDAWERVFGDLCRQIARFPSDWGPTPSLPPELGELVGRTVSFSTETDEDVAAE